MELIFELIAEFIGQLVFEAVVELGGRGLARVLDTRIGRAVVPAAVMAAIGFAGGYAWGRHVADIGQAGVPRTIWVSLALAILAALLALRTRRNPDWETRVEPLPVALRPTAERFALLAFLNITIALGVAAGFNA